MEVIMKKSLLTLVALTMVVSAYASESKPSWRMVVERQQDQDGLERNRYTVAPDRTNPVSVVLRECAARTAKLNALSVAHASLTAEAAALNAQEEDAYNKEKTAADQRKFVWNRGQASVFTRVGSSTSASRPPVRPSEPVVPPAGEPAQMPTTNNKPNVANDANDTANFVAGNHEKAKVEKSYAPPAFVPTFTSNEPGLSRKAKAYAVIAPAIAAGTALVCNNEAAKAVVASYTPEIVKTGISTTATWIKDTATPFVINNGSAALAAAQAHPVATLACVAAGSMAASPALRSKVARVLKAGWNNKGKILAGTLFGTMLIAGAINLVNNYAVPAMFVPDNSMQNPIDMQTILNGQYVIPTTGAPFKALTAEDFAVCALPKNLDLAECALPTAADLAESTMADAPATWAHTIFGKPAEFVQSLFN